MVNLSVEEPDALMRARPDLWEPRVATPEATRPDAAKRTAILDRCTETDARRESQYFVFCAGELTADESVKLVLMSCRKWSFGTPALSSEKLLGASSC